MSGQEITDPALIAQLEKSQQSGEEPIIQALVDGRMSFPTDSRALNKPYWQGLLQKVAARDPKFDTIDYKARARTRQDFTSGKSAQNITSFNTLLHHIGTLQKAADSLDNYGGVLTPLNAAANSTIETFGSERPTNFRQAKNAVVGEAVRAFRGVGGARGDIEEAAQAIPENGSPEQIKGSIKTLADLLRGRIQSLGEQYSAGMGKTSDGINLLDDEARKTLVDLGVVPEPEGGDPKSGLAGAGDPKVPPPSGPPGDRGTLTFNDELPAKRADAKEYTPEQRAQLVQVAQTGTVSDMRALAKSWGLNFPQTDEQLQGVLDRIKANPDAPVGVADVDNSIKAVDAGDGAVGAAARGAGDVLTLGLSPRLEALAKTVTDGGEYTDNLNQTRGYRAFDEEEHSLARIGGQVVGGFAIPSGAAGAARAAGIAALRSGVTRGAAEIAAARAFATRTAAEAGAYGFGYGFNSNYGDLAERTGAGAANAAVSAAAGGTLGYAGARGAQAMRARGAARAAVPLTDEQQALQAAERQGITPFPADVGGPAVRMATTGTAQTLGGVVPIRRAAQATLDSAEAVRDRIAASIGTATTNKERIGETARAGAQAFIARTSQRGRALYDRAESLAGNAAVQTPGALRILNGEIRRLAETPGGAEGLSRLEGLRDALTQPNTVRGIRNMRTALRDEFAGSGLRGSNIERIANNIADAASDDIVNGLRAQGLDMSADAYRTADRYWRNRLATIDDHLEPIIGGRDNPKSGEEVVEALRRSMAGNNRRFGGFVSALPVEEQSTVRASLVQQMGRAARGQQDQDGEIFSLPTFLTNWNGIGERAKNSLFGAEGRAALNDLARYATQSKQAQKFANTSNTGSAVTTSALGAALAAGPVGALGAAKVLALSYGAGRLLSSPRFARWLARAPEAPAAQPAYVARLSRIARAEPAIANDVLALQQRLSDAFGGATTRLAADERNNEPPVANRQNSQSAAGNQGLQP